MSWTTIRISKKTVKHLEDLKKKLGVDTLEAVVQHLLRERRKSILELAFGKDAGRISLFTEQDRG